MANTFLIEVVEDYLKAYRGLLVSEQVDKNSVALSFPFHFASNHRVEITVSQQTGDLILLSDSARTIGELRDSGYKVNDDLRERIVSLAKVSGLNVVKDHLVMQSSRKTLGTDLQKFLEAAKTIGDVYFVHRLRPAKEGILKAQVKQILDSRNEVYKENTRIPGQIEDHPVDFYIAPNGVRGLALSVIESQNTHNTAMVWGYKCDDIRRDPINQRVKIALIYDTTAAKWSDESRKILETRADIALPDTDIENLPKEMAS